MPFNIEILVTDAIFFTLILCVLGMIVWRKNNPNTSAWSHVWRSNVGMSSFVVLFFYLLIALFDSMHFRSDSGQIKSVLDIILSPLDSQMERTYAAPFANHSFVEQPMYIDGHLSYGYPALSYPQKTVSAEEIPHIIMQSLSTFVLMWLGSLVLILLIATQGAVSRMQQICMQILKPTPREVCWRSFILTFTVMLLICVSLFYLSRHFHVFGTDKIGQDVFYQAVKSIRTGVMIGTLTTIVMLPFALLMGTLAGYYRGWVDDLIQYIYSTLSSIPGVLLIAASVLILEVFINHHPEWFTTTAQRADARLFALCVILGVTSWTSLCRLIRAETLKLRELDYVLAAKAQGVRSFSIILHHILPNLMHIILITIVLDFSGLVLAEAVLSYIGVGVDPSMQSFGNMINSARLELAREPVVWWSLTAAFIFMFILVLAANLFADTVRDAFDPRLSH
jgi:peptide/nickel transport system permease protein